MNIVQRGIARMAGIETRSGYTDLILSGLIQQAEGSAVPNVAGVAAAETAAGLYARCFTTAGVSASDQIRRLLTPAILGQIGRELITEGESVWLLTAADRLELVPVYQYDAEGSAFAWRYSSVSANGPSNTTTRRNVVQDEVLHARYSTDAREPWRGIGPYQNARITSRLQSFLESALGDESSGTRGHLLPVPKQSGLKEDLKKLRGQLATVEHSQSAGYGQNLERGASGSLRPIRLGADPPAALVNLQAGIHSELLAVAGLPTALFDQDASAAASREAFRAFLSTSLKPLGVLVSGELSRLFEEDVTLEFSEIAGSDLMARSRALGSLVTAGVGIAEAKTICGF